MTTTRVGATPDGTPVEALVLRSSTAADPGPVLHLWTLGATMHRLEVVGGDGRRRDVVLGHDTVEQRLAGSELHGAVVGRYANRIAHGHLPLPGGVAQLPLNDRGHHLHGGPDGFHRRVWRVVDLGPSRAELALTSPDGDQGYPGRLELRATYEVHADGVSLEMRATTDAPTVVNPTQHAYLNLGGVGAPGGTGVDDHLLRVPADRWIPVDDTGIPLGGLEDVTGTPLDLRVARRIGDVVRADHPQVTAARGVDHTLVLDGEPEVSGEEGMHVAAVLSCPATRTAVTVTTDRPGVQVYTGNDLDGTSIGHGGRSHRQGDGIALEAQLYPDSPHHPEWPSALLEPGDDFRARVRWNFHTTD